MKTLVFLPTYNEKENIENLISEILKLGLDLSILVVDDSSDDGTAEILDRISRSEERLRVVHRSGKRGRGISGKEAFRIAVREKPDYIVEMDADFSHNPKYIPVFLKEIADCDVVIGSRFVKEGAIVDRPLRRNYLSRCAQFFSRKLLGLKMLDPTSGFRCFKREVLENIDTDSLLSRGPAIVEELNYRIQKKGFIMKEVPIIFQQRRYGYSKLNPFKLLEVIFTLVRVRFLPCA